MKTTEAKREPLIHISGRPPMRWSYALLWRLGAIVASILFCMLLSWLITGTNPIDFAVTVVHASFPDDPSLFAGRFWPMLHDLAILLMLSLAVTPAFRMRFWNIGAEGQTLAGCLAAGACMKLLTGTIPDAWVLPCEIIAAILAGALWGVIPAIFKAWFGTNETLFTLMMNYIAAQLMAFFCVLWASPKGSGNVGIINQSGAARAVGWFPTKFDIFGATIENDYLINIAIAGVMVILLFFYMVKSKHGFELSVVGESQRTASYLGINVRWVTIRTMILSGGLCGLTGLMLTAGVNHTINSTLAGGNGFTAVMVSWLAKFNPFLMILASFLVVFLRRGAKDLKSNANLNLDESFSDILMGIILFFIIGCEFFIRYRIRFRHRASAQPEKEVTSRA
ncbi:MAG: ABC transporter permease [Clostridia bacterium]|nr:ABC transporter permease [Clostridia bacterium]